MRAIVDTSALFYPEAMRQLAGSDIPVVVPAVALAERVRQLERDGRDVEGFLSWLEVASFVPEPLDPDDAVRLARRITSDAKWARLSRDAFIAAHARPGDQVWTANPRDFEAVGIPAAQIVAVP